MPHLFTNRQRRHDLSAARGQAGRQFVWETVNAVLYKIGGVVFIIGSILFFPRFEAYADAGAWTFFFGSLLYLVVTGHDAIEVWRNRPGATGHDIRRQLEVIAAGGYLVGTLLFTVGSILFLSSVGLTTAGAWCFVLGSLLFLIAASVNVLQIVEASSLLTLQLMNLTAVSFVAGSVLFTVASIPYLWSIDNAADQREIDTFLAWQYLFGSALFLLGGVFNYWRACLVIREHKQDDASKI
jgi:predicted membrane channel-forming protein YqfA (hemolysin III family)